MDAKQLFTAALEQVTAIVDSVKTEDLTNPTPNTAWNVRALATHMLFELHWVPEILAGKTIEEVGKKYDDRVLVDGPRFQADWHAAAAAAAHALASADLRKKVYVSYGHITGEEYMREMGCDLLIHAWDLGEGIGKPVTFDRMVAEAAYQHFSPKKDELYQTGLYARPVQVAADADIQIRLLALTGRSLQWKSVIR